MTAPKVTQQDVDNEIRTVEYIVLPDGRTTICMLTLVNGYTVRGEASCVHIDNYNEKLSQKISLENAKDKVWPLLGFRLADKLYAEKLTAVLAQVARGTD